MPPARPEDFFAAATAPRIFAHSTPAAPHRAEWSAPARARAAGPGPGQTPAPRRRKVFHSFQVEFHLEFRVE